MRLAIVGCGAIAEDLHLPVALSLPEANVTALVDVDEARRGQLARRFGIRRTAAHIQDVAADADAVILATPPHVRPALAEEAFQCGLHVLAEKPLANTVAECERTIRAGQKAGRTLAVAHVYRFYPPRIRIRDLIEKGELGGIKSVVVTEGRPYSWPAATGYTVRKELVSGGVLINAGIHSLDTLLWWFGEPDSFDYRDDSVGGLESNVRLTLDYADFTVIFRQSRTCNLPYQFTIEANAQRITFSTNAVASYWREINGPPQEIGCAAPSSTHRDCERAQLQNFIHSATTATAPRVDGAEGTRVVRFIEGCYTSKHQRPLPATVPLPGTVW